jgi:hypothetical protein
MEIELLYGPKYVYKLNMVLSKNCSTLGQDNKPIIEKKIQKDRNQPTAKEKLQKQRKRIQGRIQTQTQKFKE